MSEGVTVITFTIYPRLDSNTKIIVYDDLEITSIHWEEGTKPG